MMLDVGLQSTIIERQVSSIPPKKKTDISVYHDMNNIVCADKKSSLLVENIK